MKKIGKNIWNTLNNKIKIIHHPVLRLVSSVSTSPKTILVSENGFSVIVILKYPLQNILAATVSSVVSIAIWLERPSVICSSVREGRCSGDSNTLRSTFLPTLCFKAIVVLWAFSILNTVWSAGLKNWAHANVKPDKRAGKNPITRESSEGTIRWKYKLIMFTPNRIRKHCDMILPRWWTVFSVILLYYQSVVLIFHCEFAPAFLSRPVVNAACKVFSISIWSCHFLWVSTLDGWGKMTSFFCTV